MVNKASRLFVLISQMQLMGISELDSSRAPKMILCDQMPGVELARTIPIANGSKRQTSKFFAAYAGMRRNRSAVDFLYKRVMQIYGRICYRAAASGRAGACCS